VNELDPLDPTESCDGKLTKKSELFISNGDSTLMNSKCCYFLRQGYQVDSSVANDTSLLYGEFLDSPLETIKTMLSSTYAPLFAQSSEWGETNEEQKADFNDEMNKFMRNLTSAVESISGGLELRGLTSTPIESLNSSNSQNAAPNPEVIVHLEELLGEWCGQIENFIKTREKSTHRQVTSAEDLEGPKGEIEHWRARTQHLSSIVEQLKRKDCRYVVGVLSSYTKGTNDPSKSKTIGLLRRWKQIDIETTEAVNEAKDNLKYLSTLQRFIEPLYSGTVQSIIDTLPALINSIKVSMTLGLSFNTADALLSWGISNT
jgi:dynein heavy chain